MWFGLRKELLKLTFRAWALCFSFRSEDAAYSFFRNLSPVFISLFRAAYYSEPSTAAYWKVMKPLTG